MTYVDDDVSGVRDVNTLKELADKRKIPRTSVNMRKETSKLLGVSTTIMTWSEEELGVANAVKGETISVIIFSQRGLLETWVSVWKEQGRPLLKSAPTPLSPGAVVDIDRQRPLGVYAEEYRHHVGVLRYAELRVRAPHARDAGPR